MGVSGMLQSLFGGTENGDSSWKQSAELISHLNGYRRKLKKRIVEHDSSLSKSLPKLDRLEVLSRGFKAIVDELEQSLWAARHFADQVKSLYEEDMTPEELRDFHRFIYFQKNTYIRIFSALDKLGYFLNEYLSLQAERYKSRFSYYTILRLMQQKKVEPQLYQNLIRIRDQSDPSMRQLRNRRNTEIHLLDPYLLEEIIQQSKSRHHDGRFHLPNLDEEIELLSKGYEMVCRSMEKVFGHAETR
jgi:hypothetical protein